MLSNGGAPLVWEHFFCVVKEPRNTTRLTQTFKVVVSYGLAPLFIQVLNQAGFPLTIHYTTDGGCFNVIEAF